MGKDLRIDYIREAPENGIIVGWHTREDPLFESEFFWRDGKLCSNERALNQAYLPIMLAQIPNFISFEAYKPLPKDKIPKNMVYIFVEKRGTFFSYPVLFVNQTSADLHVLGIGGEEALPWNAYNKEWRIWPSQYVDVRREWDDGEDY